MNDQGINSGRRRILRMTAMGVLLAAGGRAFAQTGPDITVWMSPTCGCCGGWVEHLKRNGFVATVIQTPNVMAVKTKHGVPPELASCHTAIIAGYIIEGHVPAHAISRLLAEKPDGRGLAVPGMPIGSPGMEGGRPEAYDVMLFGTGTPNRFARYIGERPA